MPTIGIRLATPLTILLFLSIVPDAATLSDATFEHYDRVRFVVICNTTSTAQLLDLRAVLDRASIICHSAVPPNVLTGVGPASAAERARHIPGVVSIVTSEDPLPLLEGNSSSLAWAPALTLFLANTRTTAPANESRRDQLSPPNAFLPCQPATVTTIPREPSLSASTYFERQTLPSHLVRYTSQYLEGSVTLQVFFPESTGGTENWNQASKDHAMVGVLDATSLLCQLAADAGARLFWILEVHDDIPTAIEPISGPPDPLTTIYAPLGCILDIDYDWSWIPDVMSYIGYPCPFSGGDVECWTSLFTLANDRRLVNRTDWCVALFVVNGENKSTHVFEGGYRGYQATLRDVASCNELRYQSPPAVASFSTQFEAGFPELVAHELLHCFGAVDEYDTQLNYSTCYDAGSCSEVYGYRRIANGNCVHCPGTPVDCLMRNDAPELCDFTLGQVGLRDGDGDGPVDAIDIHIQDRAVIPYVIPGDIVHVFLGDDLVKTIMCTDENVDTNGPIGYVVWDGSNNFAYDVVGQWFQYTVNFIQRGNISLNSSLPSWSPPAISNVFYSDGQVHWTLSASVGRARCFVYDEKTGGIRARPLWDNETYLDGPPRAMATTVPLDALTGAAIAELYVWRPDGAGSNRVQVRICDCPSQADFDVSGFVDATDLAFEIDAVFFGGIDPRDGPCPSRRGDLTADRFTDALDLALMIDLVFFGGPGPIEPCQLGAPLP